MTANPPLVHVAVGVIIREGSSVLASRRHARQHLGGYWEFPGGKVEPGETVVQALHRELAEELNINVLKQRPLCRIAHHYPDKSVMLDVYLVTEFSGEPHGMEDQPLRWIRRDQLRPEEFPEANRAIIRALQLRDHIVIVNSDSIDAWGEIMATVPENALIRLRCQEDSATGNEYLDIVRSIIAQQPGGGKQLLLDTRLAWHQQVVSLAAQHSDRIAGLYANRHTVSASAVTGQAPLLPRPDGMLLGASCHSAEELALASALDVDFAIVSPILRSASHPEDPGMGWQAFESLARDFLRPVYAMGGLTRSDLGRAQAAGALGIAGISMYR